MMIPIQLSTSSSSLGAADRTRQALGTIKRPVPAAAGELTLCRKIFLTITTAQSTKKMFSRMSPAFERFPHEIIKEIMLYTYVYTLPLSEEAEFNIEVLSPPTPASQVCRWWRRALLSDPTMWTCIVFPDMRSEWIMELLRRSDSSLLNVFLFIEQDMTSEMSYDETSNMLSAIFQQIHRFRMLRVEVDVWNRGPLPSPPDSIEALAQQTVSYLQRPAPKLKTLSFWYCYVDRDPDSSPDYTVIKKLFSGNAPMLKRLHHRLSRDFDELGCPVFHNLSELHLSLVFDLNFSHFLDLLASSLCLKLLFLDVQSNIASTYLEQPSDRKVGLPFLEKLVLQVNSMVELTDLVLKHVTLPSNIHWYITSPNLEQPPSVSQFLSRAHFTSLHLRASPSFAQLTFQEKLNNHINRFLYTYDDVQDLVDLWDPVIRAFKPCSRITHMELEIGDYSSYFISLPKFITSMSSLKSLIIRPDIDRDGGDETRYFCLAALLPNFQDLLTEVLNKRNITSAAHPMQNSEHNNNPPMSTTPVFPCPLLCEVIVELRDPLETDHAEFLCSISGSRRKAGYPFQMHVRCSQIKQGVEEMLELLENHSIEVSVSPPHSV